MSSIQTAPANAQGLTWREFARAWALTAAVFMAIDAVWLVTMASRLYQPTIGHLLAPEPDLLAAAVFYAIYIAGMVVFTVRPHQADIHWSAAALRGGFFGFVAYATYDLTNQATLQNWPWMVTAIDLLWGTFLTGSVTAVSKAILQRRSPRA
ncbi:MAG: DUF2177 family protein [Betaproteobacteria bacterium]|nr:DUF2177 family protein [Betaproteobacteria bacterium]NBX95319.1 DUF2177 family protein [Betaproteobacteria bacterium]